MSKPSPISADLLETLEMVLKTLGYQQKTGRRLTLNQGWWLSRR